jgi:hypothetical protein
MRWLAAFALLIVAPPVLADVQPPPIPHGAIAEGQADIARAWLADPT